MKVLWLSPSDMLTKWCIGSLDSLGEHDAHVFRYDRVGRPVDRFMLDEADRVKPDVMLYISQAGGPYCAEPETFQRLRRKAPIVHINFDGSDCGWTELLKVYRDKECFSLTVSTDGGAEGPVDLVSFHPVDPRPYENAKPHALRPYPIGTCGGFPNGLRREVMQRLVKDCGMLIKPRDEAYDSYQKYANFLMACRVVPDCALSAGGHNGTGPHARTLKTRAIEVGLAGSCLLELKGCALEKWAEPGRDFAVYETADEAVAVAKYLIDNPTAAIEMAERLSRIVRAKMSPRVFYDLIFSQLRG